MDGSIATSPDDPTHPERRRAFHSPMAWTRLLIVLMLGLTVDLGTKSWSFAAVGPAPVTLDRERLLANTGHDPTRGIDSVAALPFELLDLQLVINRGAVFGIGSDKRIFFIVFTLFALGAGLFVFGRYTTQRDRFAHIALGLILAGGLGNLYDRIVFGVVRDFLHMLPGWSLPFGWRWPGGSPNSSNIFPWVFNIADVMLLVGIGLLMIHINRVEKQRHAEEAARESAAKSGKTGSSTAALAAESVATDGSPEQGEKRS